MDHLIRMKDVLDAVAPYLQAVATGTIIAVAGKGASVLGQVGRVQTIRVIQGFAELYVRQVEQEYAKTLSNPAKKAMVETQLRERLPWIPSELMNAAIECAVHALPSASDSVTVGVAPPDGTVAAVETAHATTPANGGAS